MLNTILTNPLTLTGLFSILGTSLISGILIALAFSWRTRISSSLSISLVVLPVAMSMVVCMINGNLGIAVAVAGGFTLVRFRSVAGTGREISAIFSVMTLGVICGTGYVGIAALFLILICGIVMLLTLIHFGEKKQEKLLRITIPEDYDYDGLFDDLFVKYNMTASLERIKTTNMGSLIEVTYRISLPEGTMTKTMLDDFRSRNANLSIMVTSYVEDRERI